jgi:hypothetical protein
MIHATAVSPFAESCWTTALGCQQRTTTRECAATAEGRWSVLLTGSSCESASNVMTTTQCRWSPRQTKSASRFSGRAAAAAAAAVVFLESFCDRGRSREAVFVAVMSGGVSALGLGAGFSYDNASASEREMIDQATSDLHNALQHNDSRAICTAADALHRATLTDAERAQHRALSVAGGGAHSDMTDAEREQHRALCEAGGGPHSDMTDAKREQHRALSEAGGGSHSDMTDAEREQHRALSVAGGSTPPTATNANDADKPVAEAVWAYLSDLFGVTVITRQLMSHHKPRDTSVNTSARRTLYRTILQLHAIGAHEVPLASNWLNWLAAHFAIFKIPTKVRHNVRAFRAYIFSALLQRARAQAAFLTD